jgi:hypothetical protein
MTQHSSAVILRQQVVTSVAKGPSLSLLMFTHGTAPNRAWRVHEQHGKVMFLVRSF